MKNYVILLATDDSAVETAVKVVGASADYELKSVKKCCEIASMVMDGTLNQGLGVVDLDLHEGARALLSTMGGAMPVIAISRKAGPWLSSMLDHHRVGAILTKPLSSEKMRDAFERVRSMSAAEVCCGR